MSDLSQETLAAYSYVERVTSTADDKDKIMWHGWALRDAFVAGSVWQREREQNNEQRDGMSIFINSCARCGKNHTVRFNRFVSGDIDGYNHWGFCPNTKDPILLKIVDDAPIAQALITNIKPV